MSRVVLWTRDRVMALSLKDPVTDGPGREVAALTGETLNGETLTGETLTGAIRVALAERLARERLMEIGRHRAASPDRDGRQGR